MKIGVPREAKKTENRVAITPAGVEVLASKGHEVYIEHGAGEGSGISDENFVRAGAKVTEKGEVFQDAKMIVKVQPPLYEEVDLLDEGQIIFTFLHLAADRRLTEKLLKKDIVAIAYETVETADNQLPLLTPMSEIAGRMAVQVGAQYLEKTHGGRGILLSGVPGVKPGRVCIIGGGTVGLNAAKLALGMGADVSVLDNEPRKLRYIDDIFGGHVDTIMSNRSHIDEETGISDIVIGAAHTPGSRAPTVVGEDMVKRMREGSVIVDVAIDQGGCVETIRPTDHESPVYELYGVTHYGVENIPGAVPRTATYALTNVTLPYIVEIAEKGYKRALRENEALLNGLNICEGMIIYEAVAAAFGLDFYSTEEVL